MSSPSTDTEAAFEATAARLAHAPPWTGGDGPGWIDLFFEDTLHQVLACTAMPGRAPRWDEQTKRLRGVAVHILTDDGAGFRATETLSDTALGTACREAAREAGGLPSAAPACTWEPPPPLPPDAFAGRAEAAALVEAAVDAALGLDDRVERVEVCYQARVRQVAVLTADGRAAGKADALTGLRVVVDFRAAGRRVRTHAVGGGPGGTGTFFAHPPEAVAREAVERARVLALARPGTQLRGPVVLAPGWGGVWLHEAVGHGFEADVSRPPAPPVRPLTIVDDPTWPAARGTMPFDDEGVPTRRTLLLEDGRPVGRLTDRHHARRAGTASTGHGRRQDFRHPPLPRMTNLILMPGTDTPAALLEDVREGLYVDVVHHGRVDPGADRYAFDVGLGYRIERGRRAEPVTGIRLEGCLSDALAAIAGIADDLRVDGARGQCRKAGQVVPVGVGMPTVLLTGLTVHETS